MLGRDYACFRAELVLPGGAVLELGDYLCVRSAGVWSFAFPYQEEVLKRKASRYIKYGSLTLVQFNPPLPTERWCLTIDRDAEAEEEEII